MENLVYIMVHIYCDAIYSFLFSLVLLLWNVSRKCPQTEWAQRDSVAFVTFKVCDCKDANVEFKKQQISFEGTQAQQKFAVTIDLFDEIDPEVISNGLLSSTIT